MADIYSTLNSILGVIFLIAFTATIVGLIRPSLVIRWGENRTRWRVLLYYGLGSCVVRFLLFALVAVMPEENKEGASETGTPRNGKKAALSRTYCV